MTELVFIKLCSLDHVRYIIVLVGGEINLDLPAAPSTLGVILHILVKLSNGIVVWPRSNIEHQSELRLEILANSLEKPFMRIDFAIISLLNGENKVNSPSL